MPKLVRDDGTSATTSAPTWTKENPPREAMVGVSTIQREDLQGVEMAKSVVMSMLRMVGAASFRPEFEDLFDQVEQVVRRRK